MTLQENKVTENLKLIFPFEKAGTGSCLVSIKILIEIWETSMYELNNMPWRVFCSL